MNKEEESRILGVLVSYEIGSSLVVTFIFWGWGQELFARYIVWKTKRKMKRWQQFKRFQQITKQNQ